jgi:TPP-dependent pyruvate/acetoin dehydrogenase alpha subunit
MGTALRRSESEVDLALKAAAFEVPAWPVDGMDVLAVEAATSHAAGAIRGGGGPHFLEFRTYRFRAHSMFDPELYRDKAEVEEWKKRDPISSFTALLKHNGVLGDQDVEALEAEIAKEIARAVEFAEAASWEPAEDLTLFVCSEVETR